MAIASLLCVELRAQSFLRSFGGLVFDTELGPFTTFSEVAVGYGHVVARRTNGEVVAWGWNRGGQCQVPVLSGPPVVQVSGGYWHSLALRADGSVIGWGNNGAGAISIPALPAGVIWTKVVAQLGFSMGLRSDGVVEMWGAVPWGAGAPSYPVPWVDIVASDTHAAGILADGRVEAWGNDLFGETNVPLPPAGLTYVEVAVGTRFTIARLSTGALVTCGHNSDGQLNVPPLPPGVTWVEIDVNHRTVIGRRSDDVVVAWGLNAIASQPPALPPGVRYVAIDAGYTIAGLRSDGRVELRPLSTFNPQCILFSPAHPMGFPYVEVAAGSEWGFEGGGGHTLARSADGAVVSWGNNTSGQCTPQAGSFVELAAGGDHTFSIGGSLFGTGHSLGRRADGSVIAWGSNTHGQATVPPLPAGTTYTAIAAGGQHSLALRSDGQVVVWGNLAAAPPLPGGVTYVEVACGFDHALARRSDGVVVGWGSNSQGQTNVPPLPAGVRWVQVSAGRTHSAGLRSDGTAIAWGNPAFGQTNIPPPPAGVVYVEVSCGSFHTVLRLSDGTLVTCGKSASDFDGGPQTWFAPLRPSQSFAEVDAGPSHTVARVGTARSAVRSGLGCAGSQGVPRIVPRDTPAIGSVFAASIAPVPGNAAIVVLGFDDTSSSFGPLPLPLAAVGMPGCTAYVSDDVVTFTAGSGGEVGYAVSIPAAQVLVGATFFLQALVADPLAGNALGLVASDALRAVVGN